MAPKEKKTKKKDDKMTPKDPITKDQNAVAKWLRRNVPTKNTKFMHSHKVDYFSGQVAVDKLLEESPWAKKNVKDPENQLYFEYRDECVEFLDDLLKHKMFHRAKKITVDDKFLKSKKKKSKETEETDGDAGSKSDAATAKAGKKKRKIRLDMHLEQMFLDSKDAYVWIFDPTPWYYWVGGGAIVLITIAVCLFPLWPPWMRLGVHYLSIAAAGFLVFIIALGVVKYIIFALLFALSAGRRVMMNLMRTKMNLMRTKMNKLKKKLLWTTRKTRRRTNPSRTIPPAKNPQLQEKTLKWWISTKILMLN